MSRPHEGRRLMRALRKSDVKVSDHANAYFHACGWVCLEVLNVCWSCAISQDLFACDQTHRVTLDSLCRQQSTACCQHIRIEVNHAFVRRASSIVCLSRARRGSWARNTVCHGFLSFFFFAQPDRIWVRSCTCSDDAGVPKHCSCSIGLASHLG